MSETNFQDWPEEQLANLCEIDIGGTPSRSVPAFWATPPEGHAWLSIADIKAKYLTETSEHITDLGARSSNVKAIAPDTTVMSFKLSVGKAGIVKSPMYSNEAIAIFQPLRGRVDHRWLYFALPRAAASAVTDTAVKGATFNKASLAKLRLTVPEVQVQSKIAEVLDTLDAAIRGTEAVVAKLKAMKQGLLHDLLTRGIDANGDLRPPHTEAPHLYKETPLGWLPKEWDAVPLGDYTQHDITYGIVQAGPHIEGGIPYVRTGDMSGNALVRETMLCTSERIARSYKRSEVRAGELVIAIRATLGKVLPVPDDLDGANLTQGTARISPKQSINGACLMWAIRHQRGQDAIMKEVKGSTFMEISLGALRQVPIGMPKERDEQDEIALRLSRQERTISAEQAMLDKLRLQKTGLMDDLLTGRVPVTPLLGGEAAHGA